MPLDICAVSQVHKLKHKAWFKKIRTVCESTPKTQITLLESLINFETVSLLLCYGPQLPINITAIYMASKCQTVLKCINFIPNKLCLSKLCRKKYVDMMTSLDGESSSLVYHFTTDYTTNCYSPKNAAISRACKPAEWVL